MWATITSTANRYCHRGYSRFVHPTSQDVWVVAHTIKFSAIPVEIPWVRWRCLACDFLFHCRWPVVHECAVLPCVEHNSTACRDMAEVVCPALGVDVLTINECVDVALHGTEVCHQFDVVVPPVPWSIFYGSALKCLRHLPVQFWRDVLELGLLCSGCFLGIEVLFHGGCRVCSW